MWWPSCQNLNTACASQSQGTHEDIYDACLHISHPELSTSPCLNRFTFKWQCPLAAPSLFSGGFCSVWVILSVEGKPLAYVCPQMGCQYALYFMLIQPLITSLATIADVTRAGSGPISGNEEPCVANWSAINMNVTLILCSSLWVHQKWSYRNQVVSILGNCRRKNKGYSKFPSACDSFSERE